MQASFSAIGPGYAGTLDTIHRMKQLARAGAPRPSVRELAVSLVTGTRTDAEQQAGLIRAWLERHVSFLRDPLGTEALHSPELMLEQVNQRGRTDVDCDDVAILAAALGLSIGLPARFVLLGKERRAFEHVFTELQDPRTGEWFELDTTRPDQGVDVARDYPVVQTVEV